MKPGSAARVSRRGRGTRPRSRTGSWMLASHCSGSTQRNRSRVRASHDHRRFIANSSSATRAGGKDGRTVKLRRAFIAATVPGACRGPARVDATGASLTPARDGHRGPPGSAGRRWSSVAVAVVVVAGQPAVVVVGEAADGVGDLVVDLAAGGAEVAVVVVADPVADLDGPAQGAGEEALADADVDDPRRAVEHDPFDVGVVEPRHQRAGGNHGAIRQLAHPAGQGLITDQ